MTARSWLGLSRQRAPTEDRGAADLARFEAMVHRSADVAMFFDAGFTIRWVSPAVREVFGLDDRDLVGRNGLDLVHEDDRQRVLRAFVDHLRSPGDHVTVEFRVLDGRGRPRWVEEVATDLLDDPAVGFVVGNLRDVTERVESYELGLRAARRDELTGLASREQLMAELGAGTRSSSGGGLVLFDIVAFCDVNNTLGLQAGDELLAGVAERIASALPAPCTFARIGNDQFAVLRPGTTSLDEVLEIVQLIRHGLSTSFHAGGSEVFVAVCFGAAHDSGSHEDQLIRWADMALYRAKQVGPDELVVFEPGLEQRSHDRIAHAAALKLALGRGGVVPHYQPIVDLGSGHVVAVEALARWEDPTIGSVAPDLFIPVAEASGLITDLGAQILLRSCEDAAAWTAAGRILQVAVNVSAVQLTDPGFVDLVDAVLASTGLPADRLTLEITETAALRDLEAAVACLVSLDRRGVLIAVDDFGTGYSTLVLLSRLPIGAIKIDRSFVDGIGIDIDDRRHRIVAGTIALGSSLGFHTVAEGIERHEQVVALAHMGCAFGQGFYWSPAVPADELPGVIARIEGGEPERGPDGALGLAAGARRVVSALRSVDRLQDDHRPAP